MTAGEKVATLILPLTITKHRFGPFYDLRDANDSSLAVDLELETAQAIAAYCNNYDALLAQRDALEAREKVLREALQAARPLVQLVWARNPQQLVHREILAQVDAALATGAAK